MALISGVDGASGAEELHGAPMELDLLYNEIDKLYHAYARGCGLSDCAYWMLYDLVLAGGELPLTRLTASWSYSKQTINSALKSLQARGYLYSDSSKAFYPRSYLGYAPVEFCLGSGGGD